MATPTTEPAGHPSEEATASRAMAIAVRGGGHTVAGTGNQHIASAKRRCA